MIKVIVREMPWSNQVGVAIYKETDGKMYMARNVELIFDEIKDGEFADNPTLLLSPYIADEFLKQLALALDSIGIKTENDHKIAGLLEAKNEHLQDMRKLVFKGEPNDSAK